MGVVRIFIAMVLFHLFLCGSVSATPLTNGDFSSGFSSWDGFGVSSGVVTPAPPSFSLIGGGMAKVSNDSLDYQVALSQVIDIPTNALTLSFGYEWYFTEYINSTASQEVQAALWDLSFSSSFDLFPLTVDFSLPDSGGTGFANSGTATTDISSLAGQTLILDFLVTDNDLDESDWLAIGNIQITVDQGVVVPEPGTMVLFGLGLLLGAGVGTRRSSHRSKRA